MSKSSTEMGPYADDDAYRYPMPELPSALSSSLNNNILTMIEEVKRQRGDILKLNQELKTARTHIDKRALEEIKTKQDMASSLRQIKKERDEMAGEIRVLKDMLGLSERKLSEKDEMIRDLRTKASEYLRKANELQLEMESAKFNYTKIQLGAEEVNRGRRTEEESLIIKSLEERISELFEKYKEESQKVITLQRALKDAELGQRRLLQEKDDAAKKMEIYEEQADNAKRANIVDKEEVWIQEVQASLDAFEKLQTTTDELLTFSKLILPSSN